MSPNKKIMSPAGGLGHKADEEYLYLHISSASRVIKEEIRFNTEEIKLLFLLESADISLVVADNFGKHQLTTREQRGSIAYCYGLNGRRTTFGKTERK
ncbi:hypothetical protein ACOJR9_02515 [Alteromonas sp. A081]|uniref:hypothetical protein n=1 Tax=Alteromonas sp. A081 TaxID=3410269 RepID=UPI003B98381C